MNFHLLVLKENLKYIIILILHHSFIQVNSELPSYAEAEALRLNPKFLAFKRRSLPASMPTGAAYAIPTHYHPSFTIHEEEAVHVEAESDDAYTSMSPPPSYSPVEYGEGSVFHISVPAIDMVPPSTGPPSPIGLERFTPVPGAIEPDEHEIDLSYSNRLSHSDGLRPYDRETITRRHSDVITGRDTPLSDDLRLPIGRLSNLPRPLTTQISHPLPSISTRPRNNEFEEVTLTSNLSLGLPPSRRESVDIVVPMLSRMPSTSRPTSVFIRSYSSSSFETPSNEDEDSEDSFSSSSCFDGDENLSNSEERTHVIEEAAIPLSQPPCELESYPPVRNVETMSVGDLELESTHIEVGNFDGDEHEDVEHDEAIAPAFKFRSKTAGPLKSRVRPTDS